MAIRRLDWLAIRRLDWLAIRLDWLATRRLDWLAMRRLDWMAIGRLYWLAIARLDWLAMSRLDRLAIRRLDWLTGYKKAGLAGTELISTTFALGVQCSVNTTTASDYDRCDCNENTMCADLVWACDLNFTLILQLIHTWF